ncbi:MAG TPA: L,D-transpeptidase [Candidatus Saccharimonadales bacterium]|nr:L,D-transpeptidase [Candidatus Saccharimonadales bacterium]
MAETKNRPQKSLDELKTLSERPRIRVIHYATAGAVCLFFFACLAGFIGYYHNKGLPNVQLAGVSVSGKTESQITALALQREADMRFTFVFSGKKAEATAAQAGVMIDTAKSVTDAYNARRTGSVWQAAMLWKADNIPLVTSFNPATFTAYMNKAFPGSAVAPQNAQLTFDSNSSQFDIQNDTAGRQVNANLFGLLFPNLSYHPQPTNFTVTSLPVSPEIHAGSLATLQKQLNNQLQSPLQFLYNGSVIYTVTPQDISNWIDFTTHLNGTISASYDTNKIVQFLTQQVGPQIATPPTPENIINETDTGQQVVVQQGQDGMQLQDMPTLAANISKALNSGQGFSQNVSIQTAGYQTVTYNTSLNDRWILVDLASQTANLYVNNTQVASYTIASGVPPQFATADGTFHVWYKDLSQTMTGGSIADGDYYNLPNVTWVSYFDGQEALHTAYWLRPSQFGRPESHGCVNMTAADAKIVYYFAPIGTKVVVQGSWD